MTEIVEQVQNDVEPVHRFPPTIEGLKQAFDEFGDMWSCLRTLIGFRLSEADRRRAQSIVYFSTVHAKVYAEKGKCDEEKVVVTIKNAASFTTQLEERLVAFFSNAPLHFDAKLQDLRNHDSDLFALNEAEIGALYANLTANLQILADESQDSPDLYEISEQVNSLNRIIAPLLVQAEVNHKARVAAEKDQVAKRARKVEKRRRNTASASSILESARTLVI